MKSPKGSTLFSVQDFTFINSKDKYVTIRTHSLEDGQANDKFVAHPVGTLGFTGNIKFRTTGASKEEALELCMELINDIDDLDVLYLKEDQKEIDSV